MTTKKQLEQLMSSIMDRVQKGEIPADEVSDYYNYELEKLNAIAPKNRTKEFQNYIEKELESRDFRKLMGIMKVFVDAYPYDVWCDSTELPQYLKQLWDQNDLNAILSLIGVLTKKVKDTQHPNKKEGSDGKTVPILPTTRVDEYIYDQYRVSLNLEPLFDHSAKEKETGVEENTFDESDLEAVKSDKSDLSNNEDDNNKDNDEIEESSKTPETVDTIDTDDEFDEDVF